MARIPEYDQRLVPSGSSIQVNAAAPQFSDAVGAGLQRLGAGIGDVATAVTRDENMAATSLAQQDINEIATEFNKKRLANKDSMTPEIEAKLLSEFDTRVKEKQWATKNKSGLMALNSHAATLRTQLANNAAELSTMVSDKQAISVASKAIDEKSLEWRRYIQENPQLSDAQIDQFKARMDAETASLQEATPNVAARNAMGIQLQNFKQNYLTTATDRMIDGKLQIQLGNETLKLADVSAQVGKGLEDLSNQAKNGYITDAQGNSVPLLEAGQQLQDKLYTSYLEGIQDPSVKLAMTKSIVQMRANMTHSLSKAQTDQEYKGKVANIDRAAVSFGQAVQRNPEMIATFTEAVTTMISNSGLSAADQEKYTTNVKDHLDKTAIQSYILKHPDVTEAALLEQFPDASIKGKFHLGKAVADINPTVWKAGDKKLPQVAMDYLLKFEGTKKVTDSNGAAVKMGINAAANPDVNLDTLTPDQASKIYKERYWDKNNLDAVYTKNPEMAIVMNDTFIMFGNEGGNKLIAKANGDVNQLLALRQQRMDTLIKNNPTKYKMYEKAWTERNRSMAFDISSGAMLASVDAQNTLANANGTPAADRPSVGIIPAELRTLISGMSADARVQALSSARSEANKVSTAAKANFNATVNDHIAMAGDGIAPTTALTPDDFNKALGPNAGAEGYKDYQLKIAAATDIGQMKDATIAQSDAIIEKYKPDPAKSDYTTQQKIYEALKASRDNAIRARNDDPMQWAKDSKRMGVDDLTFSDPKVMAGQIKKREQLAASMDPDYRTGRSNLFTKQEMTQFVNAYSVGSNDTRYGIIELLSKNVKDRQVLGQVLSKINPQPAALVVAGNVMNYKPTAAAGGFLGMFQDSAYVGGQEVARDLIAGHNLLNPSGKDANAADGKTKPFEVDNKKFANTFDDHTQNMFNDRPQDRAVAMDSVMAVYAARQARKGLFDKTIIDTRELRQAVSDVVGKPYESGSTVVAIPPDVSEDAFKKAHENAIRNTNKTLGTAIEFDSGLRPVPSPNGGMAYQIMTADGLPMTSKGRPIMIDLKTETMIANPAEIPAVAPVKGSKQPVSTDKKNKSIK